MPDAAMRGAFLVRAAAPSFPGSCARCQRRALHIVQRNKNSSIVVPLNVRHAIQRQYATTKRFDPKALHRTASSENAIERPHGKGTSFSNPASSFALHADSKTFTSYQDAYMTSSPESSSSDPFGTKTAQSQTAQNSSSRLFGSGGILSTSSQPKKRSHKSRFDPPMHPELLTPEHSRRRIWKIVFGLFAGFGALFTYAYGDLPFRPAWSEGLTERREEYQDSESDAKAAIGKTANRLVHRYTPPKLLSDQEIDGMLRAEATETADSEVPGVTRYDSTRVVSNFPTEDKFTHQTFDGPGGRWMAWGVFDGHAGSQVSKILEKSLVNYVSHELSQLTSSASPIDTAIKRAFTSLDDDIMSPATTAISNGTLSLSERLSFLVTGYAGSCALLSLYDPSTRTLRVACTGDSRAVLGQLDSSGQWKATDLSIDQNGENPSELDRIQSAHPDEPEVIKRKRIMGLAVTRAFGDSRWKWDKATQEEAHRGFGGPKLRPQLKTPPYLTAEPEITKTEVKDTCFMIMASDGLWEHMSSQQAVSLVGKWLQWNEKGRPKEEAESKHGWWDFDRGPDYDTTEQEFQIRPEWETTRDHNAAAHLVRNAFGGKNVDVLRAVLSFEPPRSREVRDDTTVTVVFFGAGWGRQLG